MQIPAPARFATELPTSRGQPKAAGHPAEMRALEAAARAHALAAEAERSAAELLALLDHGPRGSSAGPGSDLLLRDVRQRARAALASAHAASGDLASAASGLAVALSRPTEFADLHRKARESLARATPLDGDAGIDG